MFTVYLESGLLVLSSRALVLTRQRITLVLCKNQCFYVNPRRAQNYLIGSEVYETLKTGRLNFEQITRDCNRLRPAISSTNVTK